MALSEQQPSGGYVQCSTVTGCGGRWSWHDGQHECDWTCEHAWRSEADARRWAESHLRVYDGPVEVVAGQVACV
jgi:hypothetical protein